jgi:hypothetical protein
MRRGSLEQGACKWFSLQTNGPVWRVENRHKPLYFIDLREYKPAGVHSVLGSKFCEPDEFA